MHPPRRTQPSRILYQADEPRRTILPAPPVGRRSPSGRGSQPGRWKRAGLVVVLGLLVLAVVASAAVVIGRAWAEGYIAEQIQARALGRGWDVTWASLELGYDLRLKIEGVRAEHTSQSFVMVESTAVRWTFAEIVRGSVDPQSVVVESLIADLDVGALRADRASEGGSGGGASSGLGSVRQRLSGVAVDLRRSRVSLRNLPTTANAAGIQSVMLKEIALSGAPKWGTGVWEAEFTARCAQGCGEEQGIKGGVRHLQGVVTGSVEMERPVALRLPKRVEGLDLSAQVRQFSGELSAAGVERLQVREVSVPVATDVLQGTLRVDEVTVEQPSRDARTVMLTRPVFRGFMPGLGEEEAPYDDEHGEAEEEEASWAARVPEIPTPLSIRHVLEKVVPRLAPISVEKGEVHLTGMELHVTDIDASPESERVGAYRVEGSVSAGRFAVVAQTQAPHLEVEFQKARIRPFVERYVPSVGDRIDGYVTGQVRLDLDQASAEVPGIYRADGQLKLEDGTLVHPKLTPVGVLQKQLGVEFTVSYRPVSGALHDRFEVGSLALDFPSRVKGRAARVHMAGDVENLLSEAPVRWNSRVWLEETPCDIAIGAIPRGMIPNVWDDIKATGSFAPSVELNVDMANIQGLEFEVEGLPGSCKIQSMGEFSPSYLGEPFRQEVREGVSRRGIFVGPESGRYARLWSIPRYVTAAMYFTEEAAFRSNPGFAVSLIRRALKLNFEHMRYVYGGSSIEQQLVKNMFLTRQKTLSRKLEEAFIVWRMGDVLSKDRIIELYMNCIEFGPDIYGIARASWFYFGKSPSKLEPMEGVFLAALKPSPNTGLNPKRVGHTPMKGWWHKRMSNVMRRLFEKGYISREQYMEAFPFVLYFPGHAPEKEEALSTDEGGGEVAE